MNVKLFKSCLTHMCLISISPYYYYFKNPFTSLLVRELTASEMGLDSALAFLTV